MTRLYFVTVRSPAAWYYEVEAENEVKAREITQSLINEGIMPHDSDEIGLDAEIVDIMLTEETLTYEEDEEQTIRARVAPHIAKEFKKYCIDNDLSVQDVLEHYILSIAARQKNGSPILNEEIKTSLNPK